VNGLEYFRGSYAIMDIDKGDTRKVSIPDFLTAENELGPDELRSVITSLVDQNAELGRKVEELNSVIKLSENTITEVRKQAERIAGEIVKEANNKASAIISEAQEKVKLEADRIEAETKQKKTQAEAEAKRIIDEAKSIVNLSENTLIEVRKQAERMAGDIVKEANNKASAIISEAQKKGKLEADRMEAEARQKEEDARQERINAAAEEGQIILQSTIERAEIIKARAEVEAKRIIEKAKNEAEHARREARKLVANETQNILKFRLESDRIEAEAKQKKEDARQKGMNAAADEGQVILQSAIDKAEITKAQAEVEAKRIIEEAKKEAEYSRRKAGRLAENQTTNILKGQNGRAAQVALLSKQGEERQEYQSKPGRGEKGAVRYRWNVEIERQQHKIEILLNTALGLFATGGGRLLVDGQTMRNWGCNPFTFIPGGRLEVKVANRRAFISPKGTTTKYPVLVLGNQEMPPILIKS